jgi:hypothetical protein
LIGEVWDAATTIVVVLTAVPDPDVDEPEVGDEVIVGEVIKHELTTAALEAGVAALVVASFVAGAEAYFVHNPPKSSLQSAGYAVPPLIKKQVLGSQSPDVVRHALVTGIDGVVPCFRRG